MGGKLPNYIHEAENHAWNLDQILFWNWAWIISAILHPKNKNSGVEDFQKANVKIGGTPTIPRSTFWKSFFWEKKLTRHNEKTI